MESKDRHYHLLILLLANSIVNVLLIRRSILRAKHIQQQPQPQQQQQQQPQQQSNKIDELLCALLARVALIVLAIFAYLPAAIEADIHSPNNDDDDNNYSLYYSYSILPYHESISNGRGEKSTMNKVMRNITIQVIYCVTHFGLFAADFRRFAVRHLIDSRFGGNVTNTISETTATTTTTTNNNNNNNSRFRRVSVVVRIVVVIVIVFFDYLALVVSALNTLVTLHQFYLDNPFLLQKGMNAHADKNMATTNNRSFRGGPNVSTH